MLCTPPALLSTASLNDSKNLIGPCVYLARWYCNGYEMYFILQHYFTCPFYLLHIVLCSWNLSTFSSWLYQSGKIFLTAKVSILTFSNTAKKCPRSFIPVTTALNLNQYLKNGNKGLFIAYKEFKVEYLRTEITYFGELLMFFMLFLIWQDRENAQSSCAGLFIGSHLGFDWPGVWVHVDIASPVHAVSN